MQPTKAQIDILALNFYFPLQTQTDFEYDFKDLAFMMTQFNIPPVTIKVGPFNRFDADLINLENL